MKINETGWKFQNVWLWFLGIFLSYWLYNVIGFRYICIIEIIIIPCIGYIYNNYNYIIMTLYIYTYIIPICNQIEFTLTVRSSDPPWSAAHLSLAIQEFPTRVVEPLPPLLLRFWTGGLPRMRYRWVWWVKRVKIGMDGMELWMGIDGYSTPKNDPNMSC